MKFATIRLGAKSVEQIKMLAAAEGVQETPISFAVHCTQVPAEVVSGTYAFIFLGSDNNKGVATDWDKGLRAFGKIVNRVGEVFKEESTLDLEVRLVLPRTINKFDFLAKAPTAYYWFSEMPVIGINDFANQTTRFINTQDKRQNMRAIFYAIEAVCLGFRSDVEKCFPELSGLFNYTPSDPAGSISSNLEIPNDAVPVDEGKPDHAPGYLPAEWILALCSKNFLIVSGHSGTGKTKHARDIARALDYTLPAEFSGSRSNPANCLAFIPVGANWNNPNPLFGFKNPFGAELKHISVDGEEISTNEIYDPPAALLLLLRAVERPDHPHFLVLDEMNLSHVERYFYPFLSLIEANRGLDAQSKADFLDADTLNLVALTLENKKKHPLEAQTARRLSNEGKGLSFPANVFVIGTVNVDETTYMFSPKVLDRAHVIESRAQKPSEYFKGSVQSSEDLITKEKAMELLRTSIQRTRGGFWEREHPRAVLVEVAKQQALSMDKFEQIDQAIFKTIKGISTILDPVGFGFAYRTVNEFTSYIAVFIELADNSIFGSSQWIGALDRAVFQKLLPKIHGNRRQLGLSLKALSAFFRGKEQGDTLYTLGNMRIEIAESEGLGFELPLSAEKIERMHQRLETTGYTTFVE